MNIPMPLLITALVIIVAIVAFEYAQYRKYSTPYSVRVMVVGTDKIERRYVSKYDPSSMLTTIGKHKYVVNTDGRLESRVYHGLISIPTYHYDEGNPEPRVPNKGKPKVESSQVDTAIRNHAVRQLLEAFQGELLNDMMRFIITLGAIGLAGYCVQWSITNKLKALAVLLGTE